MEKRRTFASEAVSRGHPDKVADQISDAVVDAVFIREREQEQCPADELGASRVACEVLVARDSVFIAGEVNGHSQAQGGWMPDNRISTEDLAQVIGAHIDLETLVRDTVADIGYADHMTHGFDAASLKVINRLAGQSAQIHKGTTGKADPRDLGAGDQGMMFGYATHECQAFTDIPALQTTCMPAPIAVCRYLLTELDKVRQSPDNPGLGPDAKTQVTMAYATDAGGRQRVLPQLENLILSTQHAEGLALADLRAWVHDAFLPRVLPAHMLAACDIFINSAGAFTHAGPAADAGLTGRKIIVDTYGGMARHGGGAFSGKDPTKVDRSGAYAARYLARALVSEGIAERCEVQVAYAIGDPEPKNVYIDTFGTARTGAPSDAQLATRAQQYFPLRPYDIITQLRLWQPIYRDTAAFGHFGRDTAAGLPWEQRPPQDLIDGLLDG